MPFVEVNIQKEIEKRRQSDPDFKELWDKQKKTIQFHKKVQPGTNLKKKFVHQKKLNVLIGEQ